LALAAAAAASDAISPDITRATNPSRADCLLFLPQEFVPNVWPVLKKGKKALVMTYIKVNITNEFRNFFCHV